MTRQKLKRKRLSQPWEVGESGERTGRFEPTLKGSWDLPLRNFSKMMMGAGKVWWLNSLFPNFTSEEKTHLLLMTSSYRQKLFGSHWHIKADSLDVLRWYFVWVWCKILMHDQHYLASWQLRRLLAQTRTDTAEQVLFLLFESPSDVSVSPTRVLFSF